MDLNLWKEAGSYVEVQYQGKTVVLMRCLYLYGGADPPRAEPPGALSTPITSGSDLYNAAVLFSGEWLDS